MDDLISIVVPVYNAERYLEQCLESIRRQTYSNLEIIMVDDGSTDRSGEICDEYARMDRRYRIIHQENAGVYAAKSAGIRNAKGVYLGFVDSDDWIDENMYSVLYRKIKKSRAQIAVCLMNIYDDVLGTACAVNPVVEEGYYDGCRNDEIMQNLFFQKDCMGDGLSLNFSDKLILRELVQNNYNKVDSRLHYFEDIAIVLLCMIQAEGIEVCNKPLYYYRQRKDSLCHSEDSSYLEQVNLFYKSVYSVTGAFSEKLLKRLQVYVADRAVYGVNHMMGFKLAQEIPYYLPPFESLPSGGKIVLYGAGEVGKSYYNVMELTRPGEVVAWVDKKYEALEEKGFAVTDPESLRSIEFDKVLIAVKYKSNADSIREELEGMGIAQESIVWESPASIFSV